MERKRFFLLPWLALTAATTTARADKVQAGAEGGAAQPKEVRAWTLAEMQSWAEAFLKRLDAIPSYHATVVVRERVDGQLGEYRHLFLKFHREPKSFYMYFLGPPDLNGVEALYVENENDGRMMVSPRPGTSNLGTVSFRLDSPIVLRGTLCPLHHLNLRDLTQRYLDYIKQNTVQGKSNVRRFVGAKINGRVCTCWEVRHLGDKEYFVMRIFADDELNIPCRFEIHTAKSEEDKPELLQEYTFIGGGKEPINIETKLTDIDFDPANPNYRFGRSWPASDRAPQNRAEAHPERAKTDDKQQRAGKGSESSESSSTCRCCRRGRWRR